MIFTRPGSAIPPLTIGFERDFCYTSHPDSRGTNRRWAGRPIFCLWRGFCGRIGIEVRPLMDLNGLLETTVSGMGYELAGVERPARGGLLRVYIDRPGGVNVDDCAAVSHQLTRVLAVENVSYDRLEVSSPGLDRLLRKEQDFVRFAGQKARVRTRLPRDGRRNFTGVLRDAGAGKVQLEVDGKILSLELTDIETARLVPNI